MLDTRWLDPVPGASDMLGTRLYPNIAGGDEATVGDLLNQLAL